MGKHFGNLQRLYGVTYYVLSPHELKPFKGVLNPGIKNAFRRIFEQGFPFMVAGAVGYLIYYQGMATYKASVRKNPELYKDEV